MESSPRRMLTIWALAVIASSCSEPPPATNQAAPAATPVRPPAANSEPAPTIRSSVARLRGSYAWNAELKRHVFSDPSAVEKVVESATDSVIRDLVDCLDDVNPSQTTLNGKPVPVGVMCHQALSQIVYYEPVARSGDVAAKWPGHIEPTATAEALAAARRAWADVIAKKAYKKL